MVWRWMRMKMCEEGKLKKKVVGLIVDIFFY